MRDSEAVRNQVLRLLSQDQQINQSSTKEFRMKLEATLVAWEHKAQRVRRALLTTIGVCVFVYFVGIFAIPRFDEARRLMADSWMSSVYTVVIGAWFVVAVLSFFVGGYMLLLYLFKYAPAVKRARFDVQTTMLLELQEQIIQLRQDVKSSGK